MKQFKNILVGVNLSSSDRLVSDDISEPSQEAVNRAIWLAEKNDAQLTFFYSLEISEKAKYLIEEENGNKPSIIDRAEQTLLTLVAKAKEKGITAQQQVVCGTSWLELIRQVLKEQHDLVIVGTRGQSHLRGLLLGSTGIKLLRKCPCEVWVTKPEAEEKIPSILVANDLSGIGKRVTEIGGSMAKMHQAELHLIHALPYWDEQRNIPTHSIPEPELNKCCQHAKQQIEAQLAGFQLEKEPQIQVALGPPEDVILKYLDEHKIRLLVMGTVSAENIVNMITGGTAEHLLSQISCSVLAVKPKGFVSPVTL